MGIRTVHVYWAFDIGTFGQDMSAARMAAGMKLSQVGELIGYSASNLSRLERGEASNPEMNTVLAVCDCFDLDPRKYFEVRKLGE